MLSEESRPDCPIILCGDMNATILDEVVRLVVNRSASMRPLRAPLCFPYRTLRHDLHLLSAYSTPPECTTMRGASGDFRNFFAAAIDHIFHTPELRVVNTLVTPPVHKLVSTASIPNDDHPSDHLPIGAAFEFV